MLTRSYNYPGSHFLSAFLLGCKFVVSNNGVMMEYFIHLSYPSVYIYFTFVTEEKTFVCL